MCNFSGPAILGLESCCMSSNRSMLWSVVILITVTVAVYLPSVLHNGFVSIDDGLLITGNAAIQSLSPRTLVRIFTSYDPELYIPLTLLTYQIEWLLAGAQPILFHFVNLMLHIGSGVFLFFLFRKIFGVPLISFFGALIFTLHPIHVEAVAWAAARKDVLSAFFFFGSLVFYEHGRQKTKEGTSRCSLMFFILALLAKVTVSFLPFVLLLLDWRRGERIDAKNLRGKFSYFALSAAFVAIALFGKAQGISSLGPWKTALLSAKATIFYLQKLLWPARLSVIYGQQTPVGLNYAEFWLPAILLLALIAGIALLWRRRFRNLAFGFSLFAIMLLPNFANFWKNNFLFFASDRYAYIPSVGVVAIVCAACLWLLRRSPGMRIPIIAGMGTLCAAFAFLSFMQARVWRTDFSLYQNVLRWYPESAQAANNLGDAYVKAGMSEKALKLFARAVESDHAYIQAMVNAGNVERERGNFDVARAWYERAMGRISSDPRPENLAPRYLLGELLIKTGQTDAGLMQFRLAAESLPEAAEPYYNLAVTLHALDRGGEAIPIFEKAIALDPDHIASRYHLAGLYAERGKLAEAKIQLETVVRLDSGYEKAAEHLTNVRRLLQK